METATKQLSYGNWVSDKRIKQTFLMFLVCALPAVALALLVFLAGWGAWAAVPAAVLALLAAFCLAGAVYFRHAKALFSPEGGDVQRQVLNLVMDHIQWDGAGRALDIGCGSGALAVLLARKYGQACIDAIDYWGSPWDYFQKQCEENAALAGVPGRIAFRQASASALPFPDGTFDLVVSNLVFHEVRDTKDKRDVVKEALRVVKPGGRFVLQDLFLIEAYYGKPVELLALVKSWGIRQVEFIDTSKSPFLPKALKLPFMVGTLGMLVGVK